MHVDIATTDKWNGGIHHYWNNRTPTKRSEASAKFLLARQIAIGSNLIISPA